MNESGIKKVQCSGLNIILCEKWLFPGSPAVEWLSAMPSQTIVGIFDGSKNVKSRFSDMSSIKGAENLVPGAFGMPTLSSLVTMIYVMKEVTKIFLFTRRFSFFIEI